MVFSTVDLKRIDEFFSGGSFARSIDANHTFHFVALKSGGVFYLLRARIIFSNGVPNLKSQFVSENVIAGSFLLKDICDNSIAFIKQLDAGKLDTPLGEVYFVPDSSAKYGVSYSPLHPDGLQNQQRISVLRISGGFLGQISLQTLDWEVKAAVTPYDGIQEIMFEHQLGAIQEDRAIFEVVAHAVAIVEFDSPVEGANASPRVRLAKGLDPTKLRLGYRIFSQGAVVKRGFIPGSELNWSTRLEYMLGEGELVIPEGAVLHCIASYDGSAQHFGWLSDPATVQNARRAAYEAFDPRLGVLRDVIERAQGRGEDARNFETAISWLLWMLGFSPVQLGGTRRTQEAADLIVFTPSGNLAVIECTTGLLKAENKLALLNDRAMSVRRALDGSNYKHLQLLPVIVTSKMRSDILIDLEQAERWGIHVMTRESINEMLNQSIVAHNADQLYVNALDTVKAAQQKFSSERSTGG